MPPDLNAGAEIDWHVAMKPGKRRKLGKSPLGRLREEIEHLQTQVRARGEHAFRVVKRQFGYVKVRYRGLSEEHGATAYAVRAGERMDGAPQAALDRISLSAEHDQSGRTLRPTR